MTVPEERYRSIETTRTFLYDLMDPKKTPKVPKGVRERARHCLRHYPSNLHMEAVAATVPEDWKET